MDKNELMQKQKQKKISIDWGNTKNRIKLKAPIERCLVWIFKMFFTCISLEIYIRLNFCIQFFDNILLSPSLLPLPSSSLSSLLLLLLLLLVWSLLLFWLFVYLFFSPLFHREWRRCRLCRFFCYYCFFSRLFCFVLFF